MKKPVSESVDDFQIRMKKVISMSQRTKEAFFSQIDREIEKLKQTRDYIEKLPISTH